MSEFIGLVSFAVLLVLLVPGMIREHQSQVERHPGRAVVRGQNSKGATDRQSRRQESNLQFETRRCERVQASPEKAIDADHDERHEDRGS